MPDIQVSLQISDEAYIVRPGQILIIEEPEIFLHPESQRKLTRLFARLINYGIKVLITTHSDYILKELNTLIMFKARTDQKHIPILMGNYGFSENELVDLNQIKAFETGQHSVKLKNKVRKVKILTLTECKSNPFYGIRTNIFNEAILEMNHIQKCIIFGGKS